MSKKTSKPEAAIQSPQEIEQENFPVAQTAEKKSFPVVGIGASAGGLSAYSKLLKALPVDTGMAFVLVQQLQQNKILLPCESWRRSKEDYEFKVRLTTSLLFDGAVQPASIAITEREAV
jgi:two-component system CheB/CheR fusion protein